MSNNLLKQKIRNKIKNKMDFRHLRGFKQRYPPSLPSLMGVGLTPDDAFYMSESWFKGVGSAIGIKPKQNPQLQTMKWLESKTHHTHSGLQKTLKLMDSFTKTPLLDTPDKVIKKRVWRLLHGN